MKTLATTPLQIALVVAVAAGLAACNDKPTPTVADTAAQPAAQVPSETASTAHEASAPEESAPTARELAAAPRGAMPEASEPETALPEAERNADHAATAGASMGESLSAAESAAPRYADVISVQPVKRTIDHKREECRDERVVHRAPAKDRNQVAGTVIGAIAGGVIGNQVGGGRGRDAATVAGAVGGGYAGKKIQQNQQRNNTYTTTERRCRTVNEPSEEVVAYDVVYDYRGSTQKVRLDHDPGDRLQLPVRGIE